MANALALAAVTATLEYFLNLVYNHPTSVLGSVNISAVAPDIVQNTVGTGANAALQVNLFLHQVTHNAAWRNVALPSVSSDGGSQLENQPLALDLHYLLTVYGAEDTQAEALLGYAILLMHENPVLPRNQIRAALANLPSTNPLASVLGSSGLADQFEMIKITPSVLGKEEMAWLWTALKADYRPSYPFQVSVVLITPQAPVTSALPVLRRSITSQAGAPAQLFQAQPPTGQSAVTPGAVVTLTGQSLSGASQVALSNPRLGISRPPPAINVQSIADASATFVFPDDAANIPAGVYNVSLLFVSGGAVQQSTNSIPVPLAPAILATPAPTAVANSSGTLVTLSCKPHALPSQTVSLALGSATVSAEAFEAPTASLKFQFPTLAPGNYLARLGIDGVESPPDVNWTVSPPVFTGPFVTV